MVAERYTQQAGIDFMDTFSPVVKLTTVQVLLAIIAIQNWSLAQLDVNNAFLNGDLFEEVYLDLPLSYGIKRENLVCKLNNSIYGLKQASRQWFVKFSSTLISLGFVQSKCDYSFFNKGSYSCKVFLLVYVDDIIIASPSNTPISQVKQYYKLHSNSKILDKYFLGLELARSWKGIFLSQRKYALSLLEDTGFLSSTLALLPMDPNIKLSAFDGDLLLDGSMYRRLIGRLLHLTLSWPNITFATNKLSHYMSRPCFSRLNATHHLLRYLKGSLGQGVLFSSKSSIRLHGYVDTNLGNLPW